MQTKRVYDKGSTELKARALDLAVLVQMEVSKIQSFPEGSRITLVNTVKFYDLWPFYVAIENSDPHVGLIARIDCPDECGGFQIEQVKPHYMDSVNAAILLHRQKYGNGCFYSINMTIVHSPDQ